MGLETFGEAVAKSHSTHEKSVEIFLENSIMLPCDASEEAKKAELQSDSYRLIARFLELARQHCADEGLKPGSDEALAAFEEAHKIATSIVYAYEGLPFSMDQRKALSQDQVKDKLALIVPPHVTNLVAHIKEKGKLEVSQDWLSEAVGEYVRGHFKSPSIDRVLALALTQVEMVAYIDEMLLKDPFTGTSKLEDAAPRSLLKAVWNFSKLVFVLWLVSICIAASSFAFPALPMNVMLLAGLGVGTLGTLALSALLFIVVIGILRERPKKKKLHRSILDIIDRMNGFFIEFKSSGPFSTAHFRKRVNDLADARVVWPSALFVLLDDMEVRGVRSF